MTAEEYIDNYTNKCSNELTWNSEDGLPMYHDWISPWHAKSAVVIAREQLIDKACEYLEDAGDGICIPDMKKFIVAFRKAMEEE